MQRYSMKIKRKDTYNDTVEFTLPDICCEWQLAKSIQNINEHACAIEGARDYLRQLGAVDITTISVEAPAESTVEVIKVERQED